MNAKFYEIPTDPQPGDVPWYGANLLEAVVFLQAKLIGDGAPIFQRNNRLVYRRLVDGKPVYAKLKTSLLRHLFCKDITFRKFNGKSWETCECPYELAHGLLFSPEVWRFRDLGGKPGDGNG
ncbi:hypothetical protein SAMN02949497_3958 [Methylomagnum ishizawai]|uniref:Uncharacterized protein n=1 Tax=Methylomagnum ishizawai TaxID=1760988 RepID=A0A1Y6D1N6_9GAMM|nr:hypothetical protein [Methylomagnum ishizawai]SMF96557.1 hypothetical protein SAMN02949497_3958 [Methylomagnum ishizawai]